MFSRKPKPRGCQAADAGANFGRPTGSLRYPRNLASTSTLGGNTDSET